MSATDERTDNTPLTVSNCPQCSRAVPIRSPHVVISGRAVRAFCSAECAAAAAVPPPPTRGLGRRLFRIGLSVPMVLLTSGLAEETITPTSANRQRGAMVDVSPVLEPEIPQFGPAWPPTSEEWVAEIGHDAWIHPLNGPIRRMPIRDARVFGAERPGDRPGECDSGHCGVDIGGDVWGEPVVAVHDGVVDRVQRGPNEEHGGLYVRLAHRNATIFTQYFHLAAIPRWIQPGVQVHVGEVVGLLGDSGVKHSEPHLHFTISVRPSVRMVEKYIDPEPLIALWPLRLPLNATMGMVTASAAPGVPLGVARKRSHLQKLASHQHHASAVPAELEQAPASDGE